MARHPALQSADLCTACGICCNGTLFSHADVAQKEVETLKSHNLKLWQTDKGQNRMAIPCPALDGTKCTIYADRPSVCRTYLCRLTRGVLNGDIQYQKALETVTALKALSRRLLDHPFANEITKDKKAALPAKLSPEKMLQVWASPEKPEKDKPGLWRMLDYLFPKLQKSADDKAITEDERAFIYEAYEAISLIDRFFEKTSLLRKYGSLIQQIHTQDK